MNQEEREAIRQNVAKKIAFGSEYEVIAVNDYCYGVISNINSITKTLIENVGIENFLHCQIVDGKMIARFTYQ